MRAKRTALDAANVEGGNDQVGAGSLPILPTSPHEWDEFAAHVDGTFVVVVKVTDGRYRRRCFLTVKAAEASARRAQERGENAVVILAELKPLYRVVGGEVR